jgi:hypothetical protein
MPDLFKAWPSRDVMTPAEVVDAYENGFAGALPPTPEVLEEFEETVEATGGVLYGADAAAQGGFEESHAGRLVAHWTHVERLYPGCWPGAAQQRGDCVSHGDKNAKFYSHCGDIVVGKPDEKTGLVEGVVEIPEVGIKQGAFSTEVSYWYRGYNGDGWMCAAASSVSLKFAGLVPRKNYPDIGIDLTRYSGQLAGKYGARKPPQEIADALDNNLVYTATRLRSFEEIRDFLGNGYGMNSCGSEGFSSSRDENGVSSRKGSWSHSMAYVGADDRAETHSKYGGPLVLVLNSWGKFNSGPRKVLGTDLQIPEGSFWARWKDIQRREVIAYSGVGGWPARTLPDYLGGIQ